MPSDAAIRRSSVILNSVFVGTGNAPKRSMISARNSSSASRL